MKTKEKFQIMERRSSGFRRIFTVAFLLFLAHAGGALALRGQFPNLAGQSLPFT